jgi:hypothetical protein
MAPSGKFIKQFYEKPRMDEELYDLDNDPNEQFNLIGNPRFEDIALNLKNRLLKWMEKTEDPILKGKVSPPNKWKPL